MHTHTHTQTHTRKPMQRMAKTRKRERAVNLRKSNDIGWCQSNGSRSRDIESRNPRFVRKNPLQGSEGKIADTKKNCPSERKEKQGI